MSRTRAPRDEWSRINALETRIAALERSNALALAAIPNPNGASGDFVLATQIAYGLSGASIATSEPGGGPGGTWGDCTTVGPLVTVTVGTSGRAFVIGQAVESPSNNAGPGMVGVSIDGADPISALQATGPTIYNQTSTTNYAATQLTMLDVVTGLSAGSHTFKLVYKLSGNAGTNGVWFSNRTLVVWPF